MSSFSSDPKLSFSLLLRRLRGWRKMRRGLLCFLFIARLSAAEFPTKGEADLRTWRAHRLESLTSPDGWLSLIGRYSLEPGTQTIGSAADNHLVLPRGPRRLGVVQWDQKKGETYLVLDPEVHGAVDGTPIEGKVKLTAEDKKVILPQVAPFTLQVLPVGNRNILRIKDSAAEARVHFAGLEYFPEDPTWRVEASWEPFSPPQTLKVQKISGAVSEEKVMGQAVFRRDGQTYKLWPIQEAGSNELFFIFADQTSGSETYGSGRFLYTETPQDGKVTLDFNRAINPPCAFTPFAVCPLAPPQNHLAARVTAGEKAPAAHP